MSESFDDVCKSYDDCTWIGRNGVQKAIDRLKDAHEHELEQARTSSYHDGYCDGQRSMDAEHRTVAIRLMQLPLDEDSHGNLSQIARAVWHSDFGWTQDACRALRDELVRLLGGVAGETCTMLVSDELEDDRQAAVCWLQDWDPHDSFDSDRQGEVQIRILYQLLNLGGAMMMDGADAAVAVRDKLIHLLGGEPICQEPPKTAHRDAGDVYHVPYQTKMTNKDESGCESVPVSPDSVENRQDAPKRGDLVTQNDGTAPITGELRKYVQTDMKRDVSLLSIADRIESEFARLLKQQDDAWQATCEQLSDEHEKETAELRAAIVGYKERAAALEESERLRHELERERDDLREHCENQRKRLAELEGVANRWHYENGTHWSPMAADKAVRKAEDKADRLRDAYHEATLQVAALTDECQMYRDMLNDAAKEYKAVRDKFERHVLSTLEESIPATDENMAKYGWVRLPKDANGEYINVGDIVYCGEHFGMQEVEGFIHNAVAFHVLDPQPARICTCPAAKVNLQKPKPDPIESLVTQHTLGNLDEQQLIDSLREVINGRD